MSGNIAFAILCLSAALLVVAIGLFLFGPTGPATACMIGGWACWAIFKLGWRPPRE